jgi:hypothetical protein
MTLRSSIVVMAHGGTPASRIAWQPLFVAMLHQVDERHAVPSCRNARQSVRPLVVPAASPMVRPSAAGRGHSWTSPGARCEGPAVLARRPSPSPAASPADDVPGGAPGSGQPPGPVPGLPALCQFGTCPLLIANSPADRHVLVHNARDGLRRRT